MSQFLSKQPKATIIRIICRVFSGSSHKLNELETFSTYSISVSQMISQTSQTTDWIWCGSVLLIRFLKTFPLADDRWRQIL